MISLCRSLLSAAHLRSASLGRRQIGAVRALLPRGREWPHTRWWKWLTDQRGMGAGFHPEIYRIVEGEAIYEAGSQLIAPATFCRTEPVPSGRGHSRQRLERFEVERKQQEPTARTPG